MEKSDSKQDVCLFSNSDSKMRLPTFKIACRSIRLHHFIYINIYLILVSLEACSHTISTSQWKKMQILTNGKTQTSTAF